MGCCLSSPHSNRPYLSADSTDEEYMLERSFGRYRAGSNLVPDRIDALPSTHIHSGLQSDPGDVLYQAEIDHGTAYRSCKPAVIVTALPLCLASVPTSCAYCVGFCSCDEICCWLRKEYSTRSFFRVHSNRIEINQPALRIPWGLCGCGSWSADHIVTHPFDRGAFGFQTAFLSLHHLCCLWPVCGGVVARQRCQCNGPLWNRMCTDCGGWWCDEWICRLFFCSYHYSGLADPDETAFACSIALQAYFEGRQLSQEDMDTCVNFWRENIAYRGDSDARRRSTCCEPCCFPCPKGVCCYRITHPKRSISIREAQERSEMSMIYATYESERTAQIGRYVSFAGSRPYSSLCELCGCHRVFGRGGLIFCTEGCSDCTHKVGDPAPPGFEEGCDRWDASTVLMKVLGPPPPNVSIRRWRWDGVAKKHVLEDFPPRPVDNEGTAIPQE